ncbi:hypothetical protein NHX12_030953 [Muraenolepis orangiensis]|uniref:THUMP domain-containing protein n=1 Tax=Muraenolepis orangiensis TaxID=630683 RepID=A0A9Q0E9N4_9TELE|nr:hypothetical protein NHX12_030953 [Muraenolepis orangiensis]
MSSEGDGEAEGRSVESCLTPLNVCETTVGSAITVTVGATVPTGFEHTAAEEVNEKIGADVRIGKDRGRIYFSISTDMLYQVHLLRSVDNLFVVVDEYQDYQFKESKEETLAELMELVAKLPWANALEVWRLNNSLKKRKTYRRGAKGKAKSEKADAESAEVQEPQETQQSCEGQPRDKEAPADPETSSPSAEEAPSEPELIKFRVTCSRAGDKHSFSSNEAARDFGGAVQDFFQWKADMTKFDIEVLLNIHDKEMVVGIALTEESLHRRNITHFGPTTLRSTLCYGMLRLCNPQPADVILDPMCGTGALPLEGAIEFNSAFYMGGDNNDMAINRTVNNMSHIQKRKEEGDSAPGLPFDTVQWDVCRLPVRTSSVDIIITDMPFGKRMGSRKKNWDLYPACLREMARVCRPGSGTAVLLTQDKKCFSKAVSRMGGLWKKSHTVWVNVGGLHAAVYLLKRTVGAFGETPEDVYEAQGYRNREVHVRVAGRYVTVLLDPHSYDEVIRDPASLDFTRYAQVLMERIFGLRLPGHKPAKAKGIMRKHFQGAGLTLINVTMRRQLAALLKAETARNQKDWKVDGLFSFSYSLLFRAGYLTLFGGEQNNNGANPADVYREYQKFEGLLTKMARGTLKQEEKRTTQTARQRLSEFLAPAGADQDSGPWVQAYRQLLQAEGADDETQRKALLMQLWATQGNVGPAAFWLLAFLLTNPDALAAVQQEFTRVSRMTTSQESPVHTPVFGEFVYLIFSHYELELREPDAEMPEVDPSRYGFGMLQPRGDLMIRYRVKRVSL